MKIKLLLFLFACSSLFAQKKPNIIIIFTDDHGYADIGVNGAVEDIKTPNIDLLAKNGVRMTSGYITAPQCIPSRAGLLTGRYQQKFGLDQNGTIPLPLEEILISQRLQKAGYTTGMAGKWHLDPNPGSLEWIKKHLPEYNQTEKRKIRIPQKLKLPYASFNRGFDYAFEGYINTYNANYTLENGAKIQPKIVKEKGYRLEIQTQAAVTFIKKNKEKPFFFYLPYFAPHVPLEATKKYLDRFPDKMPERRKHALAMLSAIDDGVGEIKQTLKDLKIDKNTLIFFISDNGAPLKIYKEDKPISFKGGAWDGSLNTPFVGEKGMLSEGGIRVPFIVNWPAVLPKGKVYDKQVISLDAAATAISVAGLAKDENLDGVDLIPFLTGEKKGEPHTSLFWRFWSQSAIREGNYKYLKFGEREFLFNVTTKEHEQNNLIKKHPKIAERLKNKLIKWSETLKIKGINFKTRESEKQWFDYYFPER
ncbi:iduronate sulfatase [Polaribacter aestuariivivens]|uniref:Iduronate sulfatase n=1 Tax=Polaribacter aestuariivivens TaxID=2304626 RepID=A0A5S3N5Z1_9FLAO|nr:sulfatase-like hydrolase/transferase [Polaribacter aestuariivivens]TMM30617.1 iduronate sulfatase [Polaribacter aestuariivivens]